MVMMSFLFMGVLGKNNSQGVHKKELVLLSEALKEANEGMHTTICFLLSWMAKVVMEIKHPQNKYDLLKLDAHTVLRVSDAKKKTKVSLWDFQWMEETPKLHGTNFFENRKYQKENGKKEDRMSTKTRLRDYYFCYNVT